MKRRSFLISGAAFTGFSIIRTQAPIPVFLALALKCVAIGVIAGTAIIIYRCRPKYYLVRVQEPDELDFYYASAGTLQTLAKQPGEAIRCEGPFPDEKEPTNRANINNAALKEGLPIVFPCGPLGTIPGPAPLPININLHQSDDSGKTWRQVASAPSFDSENCSFCAGFLSSAKTAGFSKTELCQLRDCNVVLDRVIPPTAQFKMSYEEV